MGLATFGNRPISSEPLNYNVYDAGSAGLPVYAPDFTMGSSIINTVKEIVNSDTWKTFNNKLKTNPPEVCRKRCGINLEQDDAKMKRYFLNG